MNTLCQLRVYTLRSPEGLSDYLNIWSKHILSLAKHRIAVHQLWTKADALQLAALVSYANGDDPEERDIVYMASPEFQEDMQGFDMSEILNVTSTRLQLMSNSPLHSYIPSKDTGMDRLGSLAEAFHYQAA